MPQIKIDRIVSFTSEDANHSANNLLLNDTNKKWKCKSSGERAVSVVLQLEQPYVITGIDIGNENSAYIEVLVARSTAPEDYKVLLVMSSFMTPAEARNTQNINKVRMFKQNDFSEPERNEKWDRIKVVCTQPFNRHVQYGLSFINIYSSESKNVDKPQAASIGNFVIRPESPDHFSAGSLFARRKQGTFATEEQPLKGAAAIREATLYAHSGSPASKQKLKLNLPLTPTLQESQKQKYDDEEKRSPKKRKERNRNELLYNKDDEEKHDKIDKLVEKRKEEKAEVSRKHEKERREKEEKKKREKTKETAEDKKKDKRNSKASETERLSPQKALTSRDLKIKPETSKESLKRKQENSHKHSSKKAKKETKPFAKLLEDVVLVISGIQNPDRASLRTMALSMGAKYKPDWDNTCSHLICAFANTPKFNQVKGKGKIVKKKWLEDCYNERKRFPWRRYALDRNDRGPESEEEICEKDDSPSPKPMEISELKSDSENETREPGSDTDEKITEIRKKQNTSKSVDEFTVDTDCESEKELINTDLQINHKLPDFFEDKLFYVDEQFDDETGKRIKQYIAAYNGVIVDNFEASIDIIVTDDGNYKALKDIYPSATCVAPDWIWDCHNRQKLVSMKDYIYD